MMLLPTLIQAQAMVSEGGLLNPGPWTAHSHQVGVAAASIAAAHPELDENTAYILGLLHDIGRREGVTGMRHGLDGYRYLRAQGFPDAAQISLSHCFITGSIEDILGKRDCTPDEEDFITQWLEQTTFNIYDHLIQLCDNIALPHGSVLIERRMVDVALRYGTPPSLRSKWQRVFEIKTALEREIGCSIYSLLPGVVENTFPELYPDYE